MTTEDIRKRDVEQTLNQIKVARDRLARKAETGTGEQDRRLLIAAELERQAAFPPATLRCSCIPAVLQTDDPQPAESDPACLVDGDPAVLGQIVAEMDALLRVFAQAVAAAFDEGAEAMREELRDPDGPGWPLNPYRERSD